MKELLKILILVTLIFITLISILIYKNIINKKEKWKIQDKSNIKTYSQILDVEKQFKTNFKTDKNLYDRFLDAINSDFANVNTRFDSLNFILTEQAELTKSGFDKRIDDINTKLQNPATTPQDLLSSINQLIIDIGNYNSTIIDPLYGVKKQFEQLNLIYSNLTSTVDQTLQYAKNYKETIDNGNDIINIFNSDISDNGVQKLIDKAQEIKENIEKNKLNSSLSNNEKMLLSLVGQLNDKSLALTAESIKNLLVVDPNIFANSQNIIPTVESLKQQINNKSTDIKKLSELIDNLYSYITTKLKNLNLSKDFINANIDVINYINDLKKTGSIIEKI